MDRDQQTRSGPGFNRRDFLKGSGAAVTATAFATAAHEELAEAQEAAIAAYQADLANLNGTLTELRAAHERIVRSRSWLLTRPLRSAVAAARRVLQVLRRGW